jgi:hypothetical protein
MCCRLYWLQLRGNASETVEYNHHQVCFSKTRVKQESKHGFGRHSVFRRDGEDGTPRCVFRRENISLSAARGVNADLLFGANGNSGRGWGTTHPSACWAMRKRSLRAAARRKSSCRYGFDPWMKLMHAPFSAGATIHPTIATLSPRRRRASGILH